MFALNPPGMFIGKTFGVMSTAAAPARRLSAKVESDGMASRRTQRMDFIHVRTQLDRQILIPKQTALSYLG